MKIVNLKGAAQGTSSVENKRPLAQQLKTAAIAGLAELAILCTSPPSAIFAAEGASSHYLPGTVGDMDDTLTAAWQF